MQKKYNEHNTVISSTYILLSVPRVLIFSSKALVICITPLVYGVCFYVPDRLSRDFQRPYLQVVYTSTLR